MSSFNQAKVSVLERRRWQPRHDCNIHARFGIDGHETACKITNISSGGIGITFDPVLRPRVGTRVAIYSEETGHVTCVVRWVIATNAGLEFNEAAKASPMVRAFLAVLAGESGV